MRILDTKNLSVPGYKAWGIHSGIKKTGKKDLAIIYSDREAVIAGVFTKNRVKAAVRSAMPATAPQKVTFAPLPVVDSVKRSSYASRTHVATPMNVVRITIIRACHFARKY